MTARAPLNALRERLPREREIKISVIGRVSGRTFTMRVWFVFEDEKLYLLPARGSDTEWYKNVLKKPSIVIDAGRAHSELEVVPVTKAKQVSSVVEKFRAKYGDGGIKLYSKLDVAVVANMKTRG